MSPCSACTSRGIDCEWVDCAPLLVQREANDTGELRAQIDRLQQIVEKLAAQSAASSQPGSSAGRSQTRPPLQRHASSSSASSPGSEIITPPLEAEIEVVRRASGRPSLTGQDIRANDLTEHLTQLAITHIGGQHSGPKATNELVDEAKRSCLAGVGQLLGSSKQFSVPMPDFEQSDAKPTNILRPPKRTLADLLIVRAPALHTADDPALSCASPDPVDPRLSCDVSGLVPPFHPRCRAARKVRAAAALPC